MIDWIDLPKPSNSMATDLVHRRGIVEEDTKREERSEPPTSGVLISASFVPASDPKEPHISFGTANLSEGIVRLFRDSAPRSSSEQNIPQQDGTMVAVLAVPSYMTPADFITYIAPAEEGLVHLRLIRDAAENRSIALLRFRSRDSAEEFSQAYNGRAFNSLEPEICHVVRITSVSVDVVDNSIGGLLQTPTKNLTEIYELPTCPVCLERMDSAVTGLVTVPCSHTFHCMCLNKWGDSRCPVCRYSQALLTSHPRSANSSRTIPFHTSGTASLSTCFSCSSTTNLWICLICGNVGCGRYGRAHAHEHYSQTTHLYALELETQRVWDYAGDGYVHRLIQNRADGKLVELPSASAMTPSFTSLDHSSSANNTSTSADASGRSLGPGPADALAADKVEAIGIEYSYLLTSQLDSQRAFYEKEQRALENALSEAREKLAELQGQLADSEASSSSRPHLDIQQAEERASRAEARAERSIQLARRFEKELKEERAVSAGLMENIGSLKDRAEKADEQRDKFERRLQECEDQLRDVMFFLEARDKIAQSSEAGILSEAAGGTISLPTPTTDSSATRKKSSKKKR